jgi:hypothetical protein
MHTAEVDMRATFDLDDDLLGEPQRLTCLTEQTALIHEQVILVDTPMWLVNSRSARP